MGKLYVDEGGSVFYDEYLGLKVGDIVMLKSGGPEMTVTEIMKYGEEIPDSKIEARCEWFSGDPNKGKFEKHYESLPALTLKKKINNE